LVSGSQSVSSLAGTAPTNLLLVLGLCAKPGKILAATAIGDADGRSRRMRTSTDHGAHMVSGGPAPMAVDQAIPFILESGRNCQPLPAVPP
jgi:hypothetical protein